MTQNATDNALKNLEHWADPGYWHGLAPGLHVCDPAFTANQKSLAFTDDALAGMETDLHTEGYTRHRPDDWDFDIGALAATVESVHAQGLLPVFSFVYDEYWLLFAKLHGFLARMLGSDFKTMPAFWTWCLTPGKGSAGFPPHRDRGHISLFEDGRPKSLTVWIALTEANPDNGCVYVLPADLDPTYNTADDGNWSFAHNDVRALPCEAGTVFCWNQGILHWGGRSSAKARGPRISLSVEFQRGDVPPFNKPLLPNDILPPFELRMKLIALQILQYKHLYPLSPEVETLVMRMGLQGA